MEKELNNKLGSETNEKKGNGTAKTVIATTLGTIGGFEATAANLEAAEKSIEAFEYTGNDTTDNGHQVTILGHDTEVNENGLEVGVAYAQDETGRYIKLIDTNNDDVVDYQVVDTDYDAHISENEYLDIECQGISLSNPSTELLAQNLDIFDHDSTLPDYYNEADVSGMV